MRAREAGAWSELEHRSYGIPWFGILTEQSDSHHQWLPASAAICGGHQHRDLARLVEADL